MSFDWGAYERCRTCGQYGWTKTHHCPPAWYAREESDEDDDWRAVHATTADEAASRFAEERDAAYGYGDGIIERRTVLVRQDSESEPVPFVVECELVPSYNAYRERIVAEPKGVEAA
jgi:hypothetical protein